MNTARLLRLGLLGTGAAALWVARRALEQKPQYKLNGKVVLITGGSRGLGLILARKLGRAGARVAICARNERQLFRAEVELLEAGIDAVAIQCDVTDRAAVSEMVAFTRRRWSTIDIVINNAGVIQMGPIDSLTEADFESALGTHLWGPLNVMSEVVPTMRQQRSGRIVNIASIGGKVSVPHLVPYCASKFALVGLSEGFAAELARDGVIVTTVCPGLMRTGSPRNALFKGRHRQEYAWFSIAGSLPLVSMNAERAADQIIAALLRGDAHLVLGLPAKLASLAHDLCPSFVIRSYGRINRLLPGIGGIGPRAARGAESHSNLSPSVVTVLTEQAAVANNEID
jgi:NAD(P)-dependent dehydrogenase (short-subunit alcohol dehydrogenase family)